MNTQWLRIKQLDKQLEEWRQVSRKYGRPRDGWIKTIRVALGMSSTQLGLRLGVGRARISQLEQAESRGLVTLHTLNKAAEAMGCEFVYAIVPKIQPTLKDIIESRAEQIAAEHIKKVAHSMSLENQSVSKDFQHTQKEEFLKKLLNYLNKQLWEEGKIKKDKNG